MTKRGLLRSLGASLLLMVAVVVAPRAVSAADLPSAEAALKQAQSAEAAANDEWNSREMARSATREISRSERAKADAALQKLRAAHEALQQTKAAGAGAEALAAAQTQLDERLAAMRLQVERLVADTVAASKASQELLVAELALRDKMAATRAAEREVAVLKSQAASIAIASGGSAEDAEVAGRAVSEIEAVCALEIQQWAGVQRSTAQQWVEQTGEGARLATAIADLETDPDRAASLRQFAEAQLQDKAAAEKLIGELNVSIDAAAGKIYPLRAAAMGGLAPLPTESWDYAKARHLLVRAGFGGTPQEVQKLYQMGLYKAVDHLVEFYRQPAANAPFDATPPLAADPLANKVRNPFVRSQVAGARSIEGGQMGRLRQWWLKRLVESPRPLQEKLTLFWHGHFATQASVVQNSYTLYQQNELLRENAAGNFGALLYGMVHDPAMLRYLDNNRNVKGQPNENLAREILELFSMGVDQGYTEQDIVQAAKALTGYTYDNHTGQFRLAHHQHDPESKTVFGKSGPWTGDDLVRLILEQPATARFICRKLFEYFAYPDPSTETVDCLAAVLRANNYELEPMLKNLFLSEEFYCDQACGDQIKSPVQLMVGALRDLGIKQLTNYGTLEGQLREMGQDLFEPPDVKGWRYGRPWINSSRMFVRYNAVAEQVKSAPQPGRQGVDVVALLDETVAEPGQVVDSLARAVLIPALSEQKRSELVQFLGELPPRTAWKDQREEVNARLQEALILMLSLPEYQMT